MNRLVRRLIWIVGIAFLIYIAFSFILLFALNFSLPTSETLAHWYLDEVTHSTNTELQTPFLRCGTTAFTRDQSLYGGAEVRNVHVEATPGTGSSDTVRFLTITFEYRPPEASEWQYGSIGRLMTDFEPLRARKLTCGV